MEPNKCNCGNDPSVWLEGGIVHVQCSNPHCGHIEIIGQRTHEMAIEVWNKHQDAERVTERLCNEIARLRAELAQARADVRGLKNDRDMWRDAAYQAADVSAELEQARRADMVCYVCEKPMRGDQAVTDQDIDNICPACASETIGTLNYANHTLRSGAEQADARYRAELEQARAERDTAVNKVREHAEHVNYYGDLYSRTEAARRGLDEQVEFYRGELAKAQTCANELAELSWKWNYKADCQRRTIRSLVVAARVMAGFPLLSWATRPEWTKRIRHEIKQSGQQAGEG